VKRVDGGGRAKYYLDTSRGARPERGGLRTYPLNLIRVMPAQGSQRDARLANALARFFLKELEVKLNVNGETYEATQAESVASLLEEMGIGGRPVVVVLNDEVIPASSRGACGLREGDCVELFRLVGGG